MRKQRTIQERLEQQIFCFSGDPEGKGNNTGGQKVTDQPGSNTRKDSEGRTVNFNVGPATVGQKTAPDRVLPNGIVVEDYSTPFQGQINLSNRGTPEVTDLSTQRSAFSQAPVTTPTPMGSLYDNLAVTMPTIGQTVSRPDLGAVSNVMDAIKAVTPEQAMQQALGAGQFGDGRVGLGGGFSVGKVPGGFGLQFDTRFAKGGPVTAGIGSLGLPQAVFKSTKS